MRDVEVILMALVHVISFTKMHLRYTLSYDKQSRHVFEIYHLILVEHLLIYPPCSCMKVLLKKRKPHVQAS